MSDYLINLPESPVPFVVLNDGKELLRIDSDGKLTLGEGVTPDEAALAFVEAVNELNAWAS